MSSQATLTLSTVEQAQEMGLLPEEFDKIKDCEKLVIYDLYNIDYEYISGLYGKHIPDEIKNRRGNHTNKAILLDYAQQSGQNVLQLKEYVYDKPNISYRYMKIDIKYFNSQKE